MHRLFLVVQCAALLLLADGFAARPSIDALTLKVLNKGVPSQQLPEDLPQLPSVQLPSVQLPSVQLPSVQLPSFQFPSVDLTSVQLPTVQLPSIDFDATIPSQFVDAVQALVSGANAEGVLNTLQANPLILGPVLQLSLLAVVGATVASSSSSSSPATSSSLSTRRNREGGVYVTSGRYDPNDAEQYFSSRPAQTAARAVQLASTAASFGLALLLDVFTKSVKANEESRAEQLRLLLVSLGPTFIKIGQSLSIRTDLLSFAYLKELAKLQDSVPPFPSDQALQIIESELGQRASSMFLDLTPSSQAIAAASLGQVYKATMASTGEAVAVKVQRPNIEERVALDMHLLRSIAGPAKSLLNLQSDLLGIIDDWGKGFVSELDYEEEARNAENFMKSISSTPLKDSVFAPTVVSECSSRRVLTTNWVEGTRVEACNPQEQAQLVKLAVSAYLTMMLETPVLHADPHPGNLKICADGRLCILDWGLVTELAPDLQVTMIEHIAHLTSKDYAKVPQDLVKLGFIPQRMEALAADSGVVEILAGIYSRWAKGGGAAKVDVGQVITELNGLTETYGNLFQLPPYFAYIAKAFGVIEGIGLSNNPDFAIVSECMPYVARRLLTRNDEASGRALRSFVFGRQADSDPLKRVVDVDRLELLVRGIESYTKNRRLSRGSSGSASAVPTAAQVEATADFLLDLLLAHPTDAAGGRFVPSPLQQLLVEEATKLASSSARLSFQQLRRSSGLAPNGRSILGSLVDPFGLFSGSTITEPDELDKEVLAQGGRLLELLLKTLEDQTPPPLPSSSSSSPSSGVLRVSDEAVRAVVSFVRSMSPQETVSLVRALAQRIFARRGDLLGLGRFALQTALAQAGARGAFTSA